ncbi:unnamed protein product [Sphagnum balticum]
MGAFTALTAVSNNLPALIRHPDIHGLFRGPFAPVRALRKDTIRGQSVGETPHYGNVSAEWCAGGGTAWQSRSRITGTAIPDSVQCQRSGVANLSTARTESARLLFPARAVLRKPSSSLQHRWLAGAGYYSYLFARMYAAQIWENKFSVDPLSR